MYCQVFDMFDGSMGKVWQTWDKMSTYTGVLSIQDHRHPKLWDQRIWWELQNNHTILRLVYVVTRRPVWYWLITKYSIYIVGAWSRSSKPGTWSIPTLASCSFKPKSISSMTPYLMRTAKQPSHPRVDTYCYMENHRPCMCWHPFHMSWGCMGKVWQSWNTIDTLGSCPSKPQSTQAVGPDDLVITAKQPYHHQVDVYCHMESNMPWVGCQPFHMFCMWVNGQGLFSLRHNQYTSILFIQASGHPSSDTRFGENCKTT